MFLSSILTGFFIGTSYIPFPPWATLFAFVPIWLYWDKVNSQLPDKESNKDPGRENSKENGKNSKEALKKILISGWLAQFLFTFIGFNWIAHTVKEFGHFSWPLAVLTLFIYCCIANLDLPLTGLVWHFMQKKLSLGQKPRLVLLAVITALCKSWAPNLFPWNYGYTWLWINSPLAQIAELIGFDGISSVVILLNVFIALAVQQYRSSRGEKPWRNRAVWQPILFTAIIFVGLNLGGIALRKMLPPTDSSLNVVLTQANIGNLEKQYAEHQSSFREHIFGRYVALLRKELQSHPEQFSQLDFIVWPETAYPYDLDQRRWSSPLNTTSNTNFYPFFAQQLINLTKEFDAHLFTGGYGYSPKDNKVTNTFFIFEREGRVQPHPYYKTVLLPFGEFMPGGETFPKLKEWVSEVGDFSRGLGPQVNTVYLKNSDPLKIGQQICYESLYPWFSRQLTGLGAQIFVNLTNDSWYGRWQEPYQHLYMTLARAIEFRLPLVRVTNTGISTVTLASGEILEQSPLNSEWVGFYKIPYNKNPSATFYKLYPWLMNALLIFVLIILSAKGVFEKFKKS